MFISTVQILLLLPWDDPFGQIRSEKYDLWTAFTHACNVKVLFNYRLILRKPKRLIETYVVVEVKTRNTGLELESRFVSTKS